VEVDLRLQRLVASQRYPLLFAAVSGAHLHRFPAPDWDYDLRGARVMPLEKVVREKGRHGTLCRSWKRYER
jgi:hypothetical protein